jgi:signal transduction histidine kinase
MTARTRSALAEAVAAAFVAVLVLAVYVVALLAGGGVNTLMNPDLPPVLVATVLVALLLQPLHSGVRRLLRHRLDVPALAPFDLLRSLPETVTGELPAEEIPQYMVRVPADGLRAHRAELWLHTPAGHRLAASWPPDRGRATQRFAPEPGSLCRPIRSGDRELAVLVVEHRPPRVLSRLERRLLDAYAEQAGQVVTMLVLRATLEERRSELAEAGAALREARAQLLATQEVERRLLERDLHDGAQQQLLALALGVQLARQVRGRAPERARALVHRSAVQAREIATALTALSASLYPRLLESEGLVAALRATLAGSAIPVVVQDEDSDAVPTLPGAVAEALYFVAVEAAHNAVKHADAQEVRLALSRVRGDAVLTVTDRGRGFDPRAVGPGAGLRNIAERVDALGGRLDVDSAPRRGTTIAVSVPVDGVSAASA